MSEQKKLIDTKKLKEKLQQDTERSPAWDFDKQKELFCEVLERKTIDFADGSRQLAIVRSEHDNKEYAVWLGTVLTSQFKDLNVQAGDVVGIEYLGKVKNYRNFKVVKA